VDAQTGTSTPARQKDAGTATPKASVSSNKAPSANAISQETAPTVQKVKLETKPSLPPKPKKQTVAKAKPKSTPRPAVPEKTVKQREIEYLSARAKLRLKQGKLDRPFGDNAVFYRDELARVAPRSAVTARISYDIAERYRRRAEQEIATGKFLAARDSIDEGLRIRPDHKRLRQLKSNAVSEYSKTWARGMFDQFKDSFNNAEAGPVRSDSPGPDR
jgi:hypothetical protein